MLIGTTLGDNGIKDWLLLGVLRVAKLGFKDGIDVGTVLGTELGILIGRVLGAWNQTWFGTWYHTWWQTRGTELVGDELGWSEGINDGILLGSTLGDELGCNDGTKAHYCLVLGLVVSYAAFDWIEWMKCIIHQKYHFRQHAWKAVVVWTLRFVFLFAFENVIQRNRMKDERSMNNAENESAVNYCYSAM